MNAPDLQDRQLHERSLELAAMAVDFDLTDAETADLHAHLSTCSACTRRAASMRTDASRLSAPMTLLPSSRVDAAIYAEIARRRQRPERLVLVVAAALLLLAALLGAAAVGAYLVRTQQTLPTTVVPTPTDPPALVSPGPDASPAIVGETWETIDFPQESNGRLIEAVTFSGTDLVGVGRGACLPDSNAPTNCYGAAWTAAPGQPWIGAPDQPGLEVGLTFPISGPAKGIFDVAAGPAGLVAIGYDYDPPRCGIAPCSSGPGVWRSPDGRTWERATIDLGGGIIDAFNLPIAAIAAGPQGYVMVGYQETLNRDGSIGPAHAAAWTSGDGTTWTRAKDSADMDVGPCFDTGEAPACGGMRAVTATGSGFVAVGQAHTGSAPDQVRPAAWTSPDGLIWTRSDAGLDFDGHLSGVTLGGVGVVAVGTICQPTCFDLAPGVAATSRDGATWTFSPMAGATELRGVANLGDGGQVFALGSSGLADAPPAPPAELQLWRSADGVAWQLVTGLPAIPDAAGYGGADIAAGDDRLIVAGWAEVYASDGARNFAYVSPPIAAATVTLPPWTALDFQGGAPSGSMQAVAPTVSGFVAVAGSVCAAGPEPSPCQASIWTAAADQAWTRAPDQPSLVVSLGVVSTGSGPGAFDVASGPAGIVAVGYAQDPADGRVRAAIWASRDGRAWQRVELGSSPVDAHFAAIASNPQGYVIVGWVEHYLDTPGDIRGRAASWTSPDGITWTRATDTADMDIGPCWDALETASCGGMHGVTASNGGFVAVGHTRTEASANGKLRPATWTSPDGKTWTRTDGGLDFGGNDGFLSAVTAGGFGVVAVGTICQPTCNLTPWDSNAGAGVAANSVNGSIWSIQPIAGAVGLTDVTSVVISDSMRKVFALGLGRHKADASAFPADVLQLWFSGANGGWESTELPQIGDGFATYGGAAIATGLDRLVLVGGIQQYVEGAPSEIDARGSHSFSYVSH